MPPHAAVHDVAVLTSVVPHYEQRVTKVKHLVALCLIAQLYLFT